MLSITELPEEMLSSIIECIPNHSLPQVCISHSTLYRLAVPQLYHKLHVLEYEEGIDSFARSRELEEEDIIVYPQQRWLFRRHSSSRIYNITSLYHTLSNSAVLRSYVGEIRVKWFSEACESQIMHLLRLMGHSCQRIHFSPPRWDYDLPAKYSISSINIQHIEWPRRRAQEHLYKLFAIPSLRSLSLYNSREWAAFRDLDETWQSTSNVEHLSFMDSSEPGADLEAFLAWPKALTSFNYGYSADNQLGARLLSVAWLSTLLARHQDHLQQLVIGNTRNEILRHGQFDTSLQCFTSLKRLALPREYLVCQRGLEEPSLIHQTLPPNLEEFILSLSIDYSFCQMSNTPFPDPHVRKWVRDIATHKRERYPGLKRVVLWIPCSPFDQDKHRAKVLLNGFELFEEYRKADIDLSLEIRYEVPEFESPCDWGK